MTISRRSLLHGLVAQMLAARASSAQTRVRRKPKPLARDAVAGDWPSFLGPSHNAVSAETKLTRRLPPPLVWEFPKGTGYASPAIVGERLVFIHRLADEEIVECLHPETGATSGSSSTPRRSRIVTGTTTARGRVRSSMASGSTPWAPKETALPGAGLGQDRVEARSSRRVQSAAGFLRHRVHAAVEGQLLIVNVGAPGGPSVAALDKATGQEAWRAGTEWGPSYASPVPAVVHGQRRVFVFAGGESAPPTGGLMSIDPGNGPSGFRVPVAQPHRRIRERVVSGGVRQQGLHLGELSDGKRAGGSAAGLHARCLDDAGVRAALEHRDLPGWLPVRVRRPQRAGRVAGVRGCPTGKVMWRRDAGMDGDARWRRTAQRAILGTYRGSLLAVDGQFLCLGELGHLFWMDLTRRVQGGLARVAVCGA